MSKFIRRFSPRGSFTHRNMKHQINLYQLFQKFQNCVTPHSWGLPISDVHYFSRFLELPVPLVHYFLIPLTCQLWLELPLKLGLMDRPILQYTMSLMDKCNLVDLILTSFVVHWSVKFVKCQGNVRESSDENSADVCHSQMVNQDKFIVRRCCIVSIECVMSIACIFVEMVALVWNWCGVYSVQTFIASKYRKNNFPVKRSRKINPC